jgi:topoisomerase-4 subunit A
LELVSTDWRPVVEIEFAKVKGKEAKANQIIDIEDFIAIKGIKALGNQLTSEKVKLINTLPPKPYEEPKEPEPSEMDVVDEEMLDPKDENAKPNPGSSDQPTLF